MENVDIVIKYYNRKMLLTVDIYFLVKSVMDTYGDDITMQFIAMDSIEQEKSSRTEDCGLTLIDERFWILELASGCVVRRNHNLEQHVSERGQK